MLGVKRAPPSARRTLTEREPQTAKLKQVPAYTKICVHTEIPGKPHGGTLGSPTSGRTAPAPPAGPVSGQQTPPPTRLGGSVWVSQAAASQTLSGLSTPLLTADSVPSRPLLNQEESKRKSRSAILKETGLNSEGTEKRILGSQVIVVVRNCTRSRTQENFPSARHSRDSVMKNPMRNGPCLAEQGQRADPLPSQMGLTLMVFFFFF